MVNPPDHVRMFSPEGIGSKQYVPHPFPTPRAPLEKQSATSPFASVTLMLFSNGVPMTVMYPSDGTVTSSKR